MSPLPLPSRDRIRAMPSGRARAGVIRMLYAARCSLAEIAEHLHVGIDEVRRTLHRPVRCAR